MDEMVGNLLDIVTPEHGVLIAIREDGKVLWVYIDGLCRLRVCDIPALEINDERPNAT